MASSQVSGVIRLTDNEDSRQDVPAEVLARALTGMQQIIYLVATLQLEVGFVSPRKSTRGI